MIRVTLYHDTNNRLTGYEMSGHADSAPYGQDLVCAAASTLAIVTENSLDVQGVHYEAEMNEGYFKLDLAPIDDADDADEALVAQAVLKTLEVGVNSLAQTYPKFIKANSVLV